MAAEIERKLKGPLNKYILKPNASAKADVWKHFSLIYEERESSGQSRVEGSVVEVDELKYYCACNKCRKVYVYKSSDGSSHGTKNLIDHLKNCGGSGQGQLQINQCLKRKALLSKEDIDLLKRREVEYCVEGYQSFRAVEHSGLKGLLQTCIDFGARYGKIDIEDILVKRNAVSRETVIMAAQVKKELAKILKGAYTAKIIWPRNTKIGGYSAATTFGVTNRDWCLGETLELVYHYRPCMVYGIK